MHIVAIQSHLTHILISKFMDVQTFLLATELNGIEFIDTSIKSF